MGHPFMQEKTRGQGLYSSIYGMGILLLLLCMAALAAIAQEAKTLKVAVGMAKPPYVEGGGESGLEVDLVVAAFRAAGYQVVIQQWPQARSLQSLLHDKTDAMISLAEGAYPGLFISQPVINYRNRLIVLSSSGIHLKTLADLSGFRVASFQNASLLLGEDYAKAVRHALQYNEFADQESLNRMLFNRRIDVVVSDEWIFRSYATQSSLNGRSEPTISFNLLPDIPRCVGFHQKVLRDDFNRGLQFIIRTGEAEKIRLYYENKYNGSRGRR